MGDDNLVDRVMLAAVSISFDTLKEMIEDIDKELKASPTETTYVTKEGYKITADVGYVADWWREYRSILIERYNLDL